LRYDELYPTIPAMVHHSAVAYGDKTYIIDGDVSWSFRDMEQRMLEAGRAYIALGIRPGDRVALLGPNSARWAQAALGIHAAGGIVIPLNTRFKAAELGYILRKSGAAAVVTVGDFLGVDHVGMIKEGAAGTEAVTRIVVLDDAVIDGTTTFGDFLAAGAAVPESEILERAAAIGGGDISDIMFTSGTTGSPKGVPHSHQVTVRVYSWLMDDLCIDERDIHAIVPPFFHCFGYKNGMLGGLMKGVTIIPVATFDALGLLELIERERVSVLLGPPTIFVDLMNHPRRGEFDLSTLRVAAASAANVPFTVIEGIRDVLGFEAVYSAYGLTEAHAVVTVSRPGDPIEVVAATAGRPVDGVEVVIVDRDGAPLPPNEPGEILVDGYQVMTGYWDDPEETEKALTPDGRLRTGDIGFLDDGGNLTITDRIKDMFIVGGFNAYPAEIESALVKHPGIQHAAVVGVEDDRLGEVGWAYVVPKEGAELTESEVIDFARRSLANFKVPRRVLIVDDLPRNATMKVLKFELRERARATREREALAAAHK